MTTEPSWLHISAEGLAAGATAAALTYTLVSWTAGAAATGTGVLVDAGGAVAACDERVNPVLGVVEDVFHLVGGGELADPFACVVPGVRVVELGLGLGRA